VGDLLALGSPVECGAGIRERAGGGLAFALRTNLSSTLMMSARAMRAAGRFKRSAKVCRALRLFAAALAAMCEVEPGPLVDQTPKAQRRFGALAVILSLEP
jgi:hypothetical protein